MGAARTHPRQATQRAALARHRASLTMIRAMDQNSTLDQSALTERTPETRRALTRRALATRRTELVLRMMHSLRGDRIGTVHPFAGAGEWRRVNQE